MRQAHASMTPVARALFESMKSSGPMTPERLVPELKRARDMLDLAIRSLEGDDSAMAHLRSLVN